MSKILVSSTQHPISKLKLFKFDNLDLKNSSLSKKQIFLLQKRAELQAWNHDYWCKNNSEFQQKKKTFIHTKLKNQVDKDQLLNDSNQSHQELAAFYKDFLNSNRNKHIDYNFEWYKRNISLLWLTFVVSLEGLFRRK